MAIVVILIVLGLVSLILGIMMVSKPMNKAQLSMNPFGGKTKEHHQGFSLKKSIFSSLQGTEIDMTGNIIITSGGILAMNWDDFIKNKVYAEIPTRAYETKSKTPVYGSWAAAFKPLKGYLDNFITKTPQVAAIMAMADIDIYISDLIAREEIENVIGKKLVISQKLAKDIFGGEDKLSPFEKSYGVDMFNPRLFDLNLGKRSLEATEKLFESKKFKESVSNMMKDNKMTEEQAINATLAATGMAKKTLFGLEGVPGAIEKLADVAKVFFEKKS